MPNNTTSLMVIDLESTCWDGPVPADEVSDIIEIGYCLIHLQTLKITHSGSLPVWPTRSKITPFCTKLNGWTMEALRDCGYDLSGAFEMLIKQGSRTLPWASWGAYDKNMIEKSAKEFQLDRPVSTKHTNVKTLYAIAANRDKECGMAEALAELKMPLKGRHHSGVDDAVNIAEILIHLIKRMRSTNG